MKNKEPKGEVCLDYCPQGNDPKTCKFCADWVKPLPEEKEIQKMG